MPLISPKLTPPSQPHSQDTFDQNCYKILQSSIFNYDPSMGFEFRIDAIRYFINDDHEQPLKSLEQISNHLYNILFLELAQHFTCNDQFRLSVCLASWLHNYYAYAHGLHFPCLKKTILIKPKTPDSVRIMEKIYTTFRLCGVPVKTIDDTGFYTHIGHPEDFFETIGKTNETVFLDLTKYYRSDHYTKILDRLGQYTVRYFIDTFPVIALSPFDNSSGVPLQSVEEFTL